MNPKVKELKERIKKQKSIEEKNEMPDKKIISLSHNIDTIENTKEKNKPKTKKEIKQEKRLSKREKRLNNPLYLDYMEYITSNKDEIQKDMDEIKQKEREERKKRSQHIDAFWFRLPGHFEARK